LKTGQALPPENMKIPAIKTPASPQEALQVQQDMRQHVRIQDDFGKIRTVAGIDVGYDLQKNMSKAALVLMDIDHLAPIHSIVEFDETPFPYVPGLLSFREAPVILKALSRLKDAPDILFIDGQGIAHPRRLGIASHIGVLMDMPSVGIAKSVLCGSYKEPDLQKGSAEPLVHKGEKIATAYRSREKVKPIFISPGHKIGHESAVKLVARCLTKYRLPEPTRIADKLSKTSQPTLL
jgi:deoxyribonuclease V